ncbi:phage minor head protein [Brevundimonas sp. EYE_349]|uniref:phage minor head protein n=1 Tax=Brevundimonas sp. EYE_349 TaxID=2853455 RepID=UPI0020044A9D|nr:phage minor head protein [Brevundimonas sp. EYE_349]MCK6103330.1 phage head morphogenesis protein [Brevundimonas sp. EYE_349]
MIALDAFDQRAAVFEAEFLEALAQAYGGAMDAVDINAVIAALEAGDEAALANALNIDEGVHSGLTVALSSGLFYALLGNIVIAMKGFASRHKSRVNPSADIARLREDIERSILQPMARRSYEAITTAHRELQKGDMTPRDKATLIIRSIAMAPDQARSAAHFARALHESMTAKDRSIQDGKTYVTPATAKLIIQRHMKHLNAAQRSALRTAFANGLTGDGATTLQHKHDRALIKYRQSVIARQEAIRTMHVGEYLAFKQGKANRSIPRDARRYWKTRGDERVRHDHRMVQVMNPQGVDVGQAFQTPLGPVMHPPLEVNCRCRVVVRRPSDADE